MKSIDKDNFFNLVALHSGIDLESTQRVVYGMIKTIAKELKDKQVVKLPDWGEFRLKVHKSRNYRDVNTGSIQVLPPKVNVKFTPDHKVKKHFNSLN